MVHAAEAFTWDTTVAQVDGTEVLGGGDGVVFLVLVAGQVAMTVEGLEGEAGVADMFDERDWTVLWLWSTFWKLWPRASRNQGTWFVAVLGISVWPSAPPLATRVKKKTHPLPVAPLAYSCWPLESIGSRFHCSQKSSIG